MKSKTINRNRCKGLIAECGLDRDFARASHKAHCEDDNTDLLNLREEYGETLSKCAENMNYARYKRVARAKKQIEGYVNLGGALFVTLTFKDEVFAKTSEKTRRRYVARYLKMHCASYLANIDYGNDGLVREYVDDFGEIRKSTAREHYHAIVLPYLGNLMLKPWHKYGAIKVEKVRNSLKDAEKVAKYVSKLTNHAFKVNPYMSSRFIRSRDKEALKLFFDRDYFDDEKNRGA